MRYIREYNEYNYYQEVDMFEYPDEEDLVDINYNLFKYVRDRFEDKDRCESRLRVKMESSNEYFTKYIVVYYYDRVIMVIVETGDEWFYVCDLNNGRSYYKCDQMEGIVKYIDDYDRRKLYRYESYIKESLEENGVYKISREEIADYVVRIYEGEGIQEDFTDSEIDKIQGLGLHSDFEFGYDDGYYEISIRINSNSPDPEDDEEIFVIKLKDEWYLVKSRWAGNYKCDQFYVLLRVLDYIKKRFIENMVKESNELLEKDGVREITEAEYNDRVKNRWEAFTELELEELRKVIITHSYSQVFHLNNGKYGLYYDHNRMGINIHIEKYEDEWYYVRITNVVFDRDSFFKCDQFDSLLGLVKIF